MLYKNKHKTFNDTWKRSIHSHGKIFLDFPKYVHVLLIFADVNNLQTVTKALNSLKHFILDRTEMN